MGEGRMQILEAVEKYGSMNRASKALKMSYKTMWCKIQSTEAHSGMKIVITHHNKGTRLTSEGKALLRSYKRLKRECLAADDRIFEDIFSSSPP